VVKEAIRIDEITAIPVRSLICAKSQREPIFSLFALLYRGGISVNLRQLSVLCLLCSPAAAQFYNISTIAGNGRLEFGAGGQATSASLVQPRYVAVDSAGNFYVSDSYFEQVFRVTPAGVITAYAGNGIQGSSGDGGQATAAELFNPEGLAVDSANNLYIADSGNYRLRMVTPAGVISTVALIGTGVGALAVDGSGNVYVSGGEVVVKVNAAGTVTPFAGNGNAGFSGDNGPAISASLLNPQGLCVDSAGNVYLADTQNNRIRKINTQGIITTVAGDATGGFTGDGVQATATSLFEPGDVAVDSKGDLFISDGLSGRLRMVNPSGIISTVAGGGASLQDGGALQEALAPSAITLDANGNVLVVELGYRRVRRVVLAQESITTVAGQLPTANAGDNVPATSSPLLDPVGVAVDSTGNVYVSDYTDQRIRKIAPSGIISTITGNGIPGYTKSGQASAAEVGGPLDMSFDSLGDLYFISGVVQKINVLGNISTVAGSGGAGFGGDNGPATAAVMLGPTDAVVDAAGNIYITDRGNSRIRKVNPAGIITTYAGTGMPAYGGDGGPATAAQLFQPWQLALDQSGNLYIADWENSRVRKINSSGIITTVAGGGAGALGDGGPATAATIGGNLLGVAVDAAGNLYITSDSRIRKVDAATGLISTIAGNGTAGFSGDGALATNATIHGANSIAVDSAGNVYFADETNLRVRKLTPAQIVAEGVANSATFQAGGISPGEIISIYGGPGVSLGPSTPVGLQVTAAGLVSNQLGGTQVMIGGVAAALTYVSSSQVNAVVPYEVAGQTSTQIELIVQGKPTNSVTVPVVATSPGIFVITNPDGTVNSPSNPVASSGYLVLYGTGEGQTTPAGVDGGVNTTVFPKPNLPVTVQIGGQNAQVLYAGAAPDDVAGVLQVDVTIPAGVTGTVPIQLTIGTASVSTTVTIH
jgi:uncharacterized protein (TIGR03437 family)